jgi:alpha-1,2-mannosyltransferase
MGTGLLRRLDPTGAHVLDLLDSPAGAGRLYRDLLTLRRDGLVTATADPGGRVRYTPTPAPPRPDRSDPREAEARPRVPPARPPGWTVRALVMPARVRPLPAWWWGAVAVAAAWSCYRALHRPWPGRLADLDVYRGAGATLAAGGSLYDFVGARGAPFTYPPFAGLLLRPLVAVPLVAAQVGWTLATLVAVLVLAHLAARHAPVPPAGAATAAVALLLSAPVSSNLWFGQVSVGLAAVVAVDVVLLRGTRWQGALTGVAAAVKLTPLIVVPVLWWAGRRRAAVVAAATFATCAALAWCVLPADSLRYWSGTVTQVDRLGTVASVGNQALHGAALRLGLAGSPLILAATAVVALLGVHRAGAAGRRGEWFPALVLAGVTGLLVSPVSWTHHQVWLVLAAWLAPGGAGRWWRPVVLAVMLLPVTALPPPLWSNARVLLALAVLLVPATPGPPIDAHDPPHDLVS